MGTTQATENTGAQNSAFGPKELYNLTQVYFYMCLHTTTLTSCPLDRNQFYSLFASQGHYKPLWRALFTAIDLNNDNVIDYEEFLTFITNLKRGDAVARRKLCFRLFDSNCDGIVERSDVRSIAEVKGASFRRPSWQQPQDDAGSEDELMQFFTTCDDDGDGKFDVEDLDNYCILHGEGIVNQMLKLLEVMFDGVIEETGIIITATDVRNTKPHIDWQDHKIGMGSIFCCSSHQPVFTTPPVA